MEDKLNKLLQLMIASLEKSGEIISENTKPLFEEYYHYALAYDFIDLIFAALCIVATIVFFKKIIIGLFWLNHINAKKEDNYYSDEWEIAAILTGMVAGIFFFCFLVVAFDSARNCILGLAAPKVYVIKNINKDLRGK